MRTAEVLSIYHDLKNSKNPNILSKPLNLDILSMNHEKRPNSASVEDAFFGDSGKGSVVAKLNEKLAKKGKVFSLRANGGANAGHEADINGKKIVTHQIPMGVVKEGATAFISRGMVLHPEDVLIEIDHINKSLDTPELPGNLIIDYNTPLALDTHRAYESVLNQETTGGRGSTGRGIAPANMEIYGRTALSVRDLTREDWEKGTREHFRLYQKMVSGFGKELGDIEVYTMASAEKRRVGTEEEFIDRLREARTGIKKYVASNVYDLLNDAWRNNLDIPFTIEHAQGAGIDVFHGIYPDVTAGRTMSRNINDATYNIILPEQIALRAAVMKATYTSSVGIRKLPHKDSEEYRKYQHRIQEDFDEKGRSTGRLRDIYPVPINPVGTYLREAAAYTHLVVTHLDASNPGEEFEVVIGYRDKNTGKERPYSPYQEDLNELEPVTVKFDGWDGKAVKQIRLPKDLQYETRLYLAFLDRTLAPVAMATTGPELGSYISWIKLP